MKYLSKIAFINSANVPYCEIKLDGNVHFIGTQGVGKSTLLRALLFFYNADKMHLGIRPGQKSFDEFYFKDANSFIVYEVTREIGAYTILVSRQQGRAVYRFIDAPYQKDWLVEADGHVLSDWIKIRTNITRGGNVEVSKQIDTYEEYRDILFGNTRDRSHRYDKYALVASAKYQNISRSIQNVFLNSKLDADFVKDTIIQSMSDEAMVINLQFYRKQVNDFEKEYREISCWFKKESNGEILVRTQAEKVVSSHREMIAFEQRMLQIWHQLNMAVQEAENSLPSRKKYLEEIKKMIADLRANIKALSSKFEEEKNTLLQQIGVLKNRVEQIESKKKHYEEIHIDQLLNRAANEDALKEQQKQQEDLLAAILREYSDIEAKYKALVSTVESNHKDFMNQQAADLNKLRNEVNNRQAKFNNERTNASKEAMDRYEESVTEVNNRIETLNAEQQRIKRQIVEVRSSHPHQEEIEKCQAEIHQIELNEKEWRGTIATIDSRIETLRGEAKLQLQQYQTEYDRAKSELEAQEEILTAEAEKIRQILSNWDGSFYQWLIENKNGWENTIGKIVDEEKILYARGLNPELAEGNSLFGVQINLDSIPSTHRTPDQCRAELKSKETALKEIRTKRIELDKQKEEFERKLSDKLSADMNPLRQQQTDLKVSLEMLPNKRRDKETEIYNLQNKEREEIENQVDKLRGEENEVIIQLLKAKEDREGKKAQREAELERIKILHNEQLQALRKELDAFKEKQANEKQAEEESYTAEIKSLQKQQADELAGRGADTSKVTEHQKAIENIKVQLKQIDEERPVVFGYHKDVEELFDHESETRTELQKCNDRLAIISQEHNDQKSRLSAQMENYQASEGDLSNEIKKLEDGLKENQRFREIEKLVPNGYLYDEKTAPTTKSIQELIVEERGAVNSRSKKLTELKQAVHQFNLHFNEENTFSFNTTPHTDADFANIALNLTEFLDQNKIEEYRKRTSEHYKDILQRVAREAGSLNQHAASIANIIKDINRDFAEKRFAGVITSIMLRADKSTDRLVGLLDSIREFTEEHSLTMGDTNLFSTEAKDDVNNKVVDYLSRFMYQLQKEPGRTEISINDTFRLQFQIVENGTSTGWVERINNVGSDGTDVLVKAMINIMLINVFKNKAARENSDFKIHCMMDEVGKLHPANIKGILQFANERNIFLINSSPTTFNAFDYKYTYMLSKDKKFNTIVSRLLTNNEQ